MLARKGELLAGPISGAVAYAALEYGKTHKGVALAISPDDAFKYTSFYAQYLDTNATKKAYRTERGK